MNYNEKVSAYIDQASEKQIPLLEHLRKLIHESVSDVSEEIKWRMPVFAKTKDFAYLRFAKAHITLGFYNIDQIDDPDGLLEGSGNSLKHIKIRKREDIKDEILAKWLKAVAY